MMESSHAWLPASTRSVGGQLRRLGRMTGAPASLVKEVALRLARVGIELDEDAGPYLAVLEQIFVQEAQLRDDLARVKHYLAEVNERLERLDRACREEIRVLEKLQHGLEERSQSLEEINRSLPHRRPWQPSRTVGDHP